MQHSKIISGIDIGTSKITTIIAQYFESEDRINVVAVTSHPALGFKKGQIINLDQASHTLTTSIESAERMAGFQINHALVSLAAPHFESINSKGVAAVNSQANEISEADINRSLEAAKAISLPSGKEIIHCLPRKYAVDGQDGVIDPIGMNGVRLEVEAHLIIASSPNIRNLNKCFDDIGIKISDLVFSGLATAESALTETEKELGVALIDLGGSCTNITVFQESSPVFCSVIPVGATNVTNDLAIGLRLSIEDAEKIKVKLANLFENKKFEDEIELSRFGIISEDKKKISLSTAVKGIVKPRIEEIVHLIADQLTQSGTKNNIPAGIVITGGGALTVSIKEIFQDILPLPIRLATPFKVGGIVEDITDNPAYSNSVGLILWGIKHSNLKNQTQFFKSRVNIKGLFGKIRDLVEPLLP